MISEVRELNDAELNTVAGGNTIVSRQGDVPLIGVIINTIVKYCAPKDDPSSYYPK